MSVLQALLESRDAAQKAYDDFVNPLIEAGVKPSDEDDTKRSELRGSIEALDERIDEVDAKEKRDNQLAEVRTRIGVVDTQTHIQVRESTTYGPGSENSYYLDLIHASMPADPLAKDSMSRLERASHEVAVEYASNPSAEKRQKIEKILSEERRAGGKDMVKDTLKRYEAFGQTGRGELRAGMDTTTGSGGSFATPVYQIQDYAPWQEAGRAFADQCNKQDLPPYGMTIYLPHLLGGAAVAAQVGQNQGITETDPTAGYLSASLTTEAGQVTVSQQLLDRAGPGFQFDKMVFDQLNRDYAPKVDTLVLNAALAGAGAQTYTDASGFTLMARTTPGTGGFYGIVSGAKSAIRTTVGTIMNPTHLFVQPSRWEFMAGWADTNGRPAVVPDYAGPYNASGAGNADGDAGVEGYTGYRFNGLKAFQDLNIPADTSSRDQAIVGNLAEVWVFEGTPVTRVIPQTYAQNLSVLLQLYSYIAVIVRYPAAVQAISGSGMSTITF